MPMFDIDMIIGFLCGVNGGIATVYVGQPLDTVKVKMQMFPKLYKSAVSCFINTLQKDGIYRGLYAGTVPALSANVSENAVLFCALPFCKKVVAKVRNKEVELLTPMESGIAGGLGGIFSSFVLCPTELVKCKQQALREMIESGRSNLSLKETGPGRIIKTVYKAEGFRGFFHGLVPTFAREIPGYFFFFGAYEFTCYSLCRWFPHRSEHRPRHKEELTLFETGIGGSVAGVALWTAIFPFDVIKSRVQIDSGTEDQAGKSKKSMIASLRTMVRKEGFISIYRGLGPTVVRTIPATAALFIAVEYTKKAADYIIGK